MKYAELHCHTNHSNRNGVIECLSTPEELLIQAVKTGLSAIAITDHNTMNGYFEAREIAEKFNLAIIPAEEFDTNGKGQILGYGITEGIEPNRPAEEIIDDIHECGGLAVVAHPFDVLRGMEDIARIVNMADGLEILNHGAFGNYRANELARYRNKKVRTGGSDAHHHGIVGSVVSVFPDKCITAEDYLGSLREGHFRIEPWRNYCFSLLLGITNIIYTRTVWLLGKNE